MYHPYVTLLGSMAAVGGAGVGLLAGARVKVQRDAERYRQYYEIRPPTRDLAFQTVTSLVGSLGSIGGSKWARLNGIPTVVFEVYSDDHGIKYRVAVTSRQAEFVMGQFQGHMPSLSYAPIDAPNTEWTKAGSLGLKRGPVPLKAPSPEAIITSILSSLQVKPGEAAMYQWIFTSGLWAHTVTEPASWEKQTFLVTGNIATKAEDDKRADELMGKLWLGLGQLRAFGFTFYSNRMPVQLLKSVERQTLSIWRPARAYTTELATMLALPAGNPRVAGLADSASRKLPPSTLLPGDGTIVGVANYPSLERSVGISSDDALRHVWLSGPTRVGKSTSLHNICIQLMDQGYGFLLLEPRGDLVEDVKNTVPESRIPDVVLFDPGDVNYPLGLNILADADPERTTGHIVSLFKSIYSESWGPRLEYVLRYAVLTAALKGLSLYDVKQLLVSPSYRRGILRTIKHPEVREFWQSFERMPGNAADSVINKLDAFLGYSVIRNIVGQPVSTFSMGEVINEGKILLAPVTSGLIGDANASMLGSILVSLAWQAARARSGISREKRKPFYFVIDEFQNYLNLPVTFDEAFAQAAGLGIGLIVANQSPSQLKPEVERAMTSNVGNKIIFAQRSSKDAKFFAAEFAPHFTDSDFLGLGKYEGVAKLMTGNHSAPPVTLNMPPPPRPTGSSWAVTTASRARYGRSAAEVERDFARRAKALSEGVKRPSIGKEDGTWDE